ncbi:MAG: OmpH family outer membrane protein [Thiobacillaceae bacterium]|nr:OmpH family outer membrane protein [Thiobacillaceae bacterium]
MMKTPVSILRLALAGGLCLVGAPPAGAESPPPRLGVVEMDRLMTDSEPGKNLLAPLNALLKQKRDEAKAMEDEIKQIRARAMAQSLASLQRQFDARREELRRFEAEANKELERKRVETFSRFNRMALPVIRSLGKELGYTMIFRKEEGGLLYVDEAADLTGQAIQRLNAPPAPAN